MALEHLGDQVGWFDYLLGCLGEVINCHEDPRLLEAELDGAEMLLGATVESAPNDARWIRKTIEAKQMSRGSARQAFATAVAHRLSRSGEKNPAKKEILLEQALGRKPEWIDPHRLIGTYLTEIEACWLVRKRRCQCTSSCQGIKFPREWAKIERTVA